MSDESSIPPIVIVVSAYNRAVTGKLLEGARSVYLERGGDAGHLGVFEVPGTFELSVAAATAIKANLWHGVVCLGCVVRGETTHDEHIARAVTHSLSELSIEHAMPIGYGVVTTLDAEQALARAGGDKGNKGADAMHAVLDTISAVEAIAIAGRKGRPGDSHVVEAHYEDKTDDTAGNPTESAAERSAQAGSGQETGE